MISINENLRGKIAVVTGGGGILCGEMARELARHGARVAVLDLSLERAQSVADKIKAEGGDALGVACNVLERESIKKAREAAQNHYGVCDILINGAGGNHPGGSTDNETYAGAAKDDKTFFDLTREGMGFVFDLNFIGTFLTAQEFARGMAEKKDTVIINISSMNAFSPLTKIPAYSAAKAAVSNFTKWLAVHMADTGIRVNAIAPGFFLTEQNRALLLNPDGTPRPRLEKILNSTPMRRLGEPSELLGTLIWLSDSNMSGFVTGITVPVDGGFSSYSGV